MPTAQMYNPISLEMLAQFFCFRHFRKLFPIFIEYIGGISREDAFEYEYSFGWKSKDDITIKSRLTNGMEVWVVVVDCSEAICNNRLVSLTRLLNQGANMLF